MARDGLPLLVRAGAVLVALGIGTRLTADPPDDRARAVTRTLAVQMALQQGRECLLRKDYRAAIDVLEGQLAHVDGNLTYLALLRDAYRSHIQQLELTNQPAAAEVFRQRLAILEPAGKAAAPTAEATPKPPAPAVVVQEPRAVAPAVTVSGPRPAEPEKRAAAVLEHRGVAVAAGAAAQEQRQVVLAPAAAPAKSVEIPVKENPPAPIVPATVLEPRSALVDRPASAAGSGIVARGYREDERSRLDDPFRGPVTEQKSPARSLLAEAEKAFGQRRYREAGQLFQKANQLDADAVEASRGRWAYCILAHVTDEVNYPKFGGPPLAELESEVRLALQLAPQMDYGRTVLAAIERRRTQEHDQPNQGPSITVKHASELTAGGWHLAETTNFRIFHNQSNEYAETVARIAEHTRVDMQKKWFGTTGPDWKPRCDVYLYSTGEEYTQATSAPLHAPGHSSFRFDDKDGHLTMRRMDLRCDKDINLLNCVLPHETTHTVLAGNFGDRQIPRWADEGMAVLTEPQRMVERHLDNLPQHRHAHELFPLRQLLQMSEYPIDMGERYVGAFYAESVSIVEYLVRLKGAQVFTQFVREGMYSGYEPALQRHYGFNSFNDLEEHWVQFAFEGGRARNVARTPAP
jgi:hypothetical protein